MPSSLSPYQLGATPSFACEFDPRFSYCLYVPRRSAARDATLLVAVHDTLRHHERLRDLFADYAERSNTFVLAPLFPARLGPPLELDHYKYLRHGDTRYDEVLLAMVEEVSRCYQLAAERFDVFGFSGGAHFAHRFLYVAPERIARLVAASPGSVTLPTLDHAWWPGLRDFERIFGHQVSWEALKRAAVHLVVGAEDKNPSGIVQSRDHPKWVDGADVAGANRVERLRSLHVQLAARGAHVELEELPGVAHEVDPIAAAAIRFFEQSYRG